LLIWTSAPATPHTNFLFLDRDGVVNEDRPDYIKHWTEFKFYPDALQALRWLKVHKINVILISNQSAINRGLIAWADFWDLHGRMVASIRQNGGDLLGALYCPHRPDEECSCRKPSPRMIQAAAKIYPITLERARMIGDRPTDTAAAAGAGCRGVLLERFTPAESTECTQAVRNRETYGTLMDAVRAIQWNFQD
jgi:D-glycero-D-manno-heptose 1,7-bisphosphate phosphatase